MRALPIRSLPALLSACLVPLSGAASAMAPGKPIGKTPQPRVSAAGRLPSLEEAITSRQDVWGGAALRQPGGPSYEFFRNLLPPLRYVDAPFHHYPITLSAPGAPAKARFVSNGGGLNLLARQPNWRGETGVPVTFRVGGVREPYGQDLERLDGPRYADGYLPIVRVRYRQGEAVYVQEAFAAVEPELARHGVVFVRFGLEGRGEGKVEAQIEGSAPLAGRSGRVGEAMGSSLVSHSEGWQWNAARNTLTSTLKAGETAILAVALHPMEGALPHPLDAARYESARSACEARWKALLARGTQVEVPEPVVNDAWRSLVVGSYALLHGDEIRYSAGNQYAKLYEGEGSDAARSLLLWGQAEDARRMLVPLFDYTRKGLEFHQAAFKLQMLAHYYWVTRDREFLKEQRPRIEKELNVILNGIERESGLLPREKYCGDIDTRVYSLNSNANCWRALRDMQAVMTETGDAEWAARLTPRASAFRAAILAALEKSIRRDVDPPFVPIALFGEESPYDPLTGSRMGSYWDLMAPYVLGSGVFRADSEPATAITRYLQERGGLCMGMIRSRPNPSFWMDVQNVNHLYGLRYTLALLQRDEPERALVSFYGALAQGMTRDTFIGAEGTAIRPLDHFGRQMYLPPNSASNAHFLWALRYLLVQDWDTSDDGRPDTLRLLFATPRRWLRDGAVVRLRKAPTAFGEVSLEARSALARGEVAVEVQLPGRKPERTLLRLRLPGVWRLVGAEANGSALSMTDRETLDLTGRTGRLLLRARVTRRGG